MSKQFRLGYSVKLIRVRLNILLTRLTPVRYVKGFCRPIFNPEECLVDVQYTVVDFSFVKRIIEYKQYWYNTFIMSKYR